MTAPGLNVAYCDHCGDTVHPDGPLWTHDEGERGHDVEGPVFECAFETHHATRLDQAESCEREGEVDVEGTLYCPGHAATVRAMIADDEKWHALTEEDSQ